jgi:hypothetical protein
MSRHKLQCLAEITGLVEVLWTHCPDGFTDGEDLVAPWARHRRDRAGRCAA